MADNGRAAKLGDQVKEIIARRKKGKEAGHTIKKQNKHLDKDAA